MNERIKELAERSGLYGVADYDNTISEDVSKVRLDKFAQLIVRECISIVEEAERDGSNEVWDNAVKFIRRDLKEHFGVEE